MKLETLIKDVRDIRNKDIDYLNEALFFNDITDELKKNAAEQLRKIQEGAKSSVVKLLLSSIYRQLSAAMPDRSKKTFNVDDRDFKIALETISEEPYKTIERDFSTFGDIMVYLRNLDGIFTKNLIDTLEKKVKDTKIPQYKKILQNFIVALTGGAQTNQTNLKYAYDI
jgi:hypothetical protein